MRDWRGVWGKVLKELGLEVSALIEFRLQSEPYDDIWGPDSVIGFRLQSEPSGAAL